MHQSYLFLPTLCNIYLEHITSETLEENYFSVRLGGREIVHLHIANYIYSSTFITGSTIVQAKNLDFVSCSHGVDIDTKTMFLVNRSLLASGRQNSLV